MIDLGLEAKDLITSGACGPHQASSISFLKGDWSTSSGTVIVRKRHNNLDKNRPRNYADPPIVTGRCQAPGWLLAEFRIIKSESERQMLNQLTKSCTTGRYRSEKIEIENTVKIRAAAPALGTLLAKGT
jgi:hypothetical protein